METAIRQTNLTWQAAHSAAAAAVDKATNLGLKINVALVDRAGLAMAFLRMNDAFIHSIAIAEDKAFTAASFGFPTKDWMSLMADDPALREGMVQRERLVIFGGGLPIFVDGQLVGGIGVSGGSAEEDEICALAGLSAINAQLNFD